MSSESADLLTRFRASMEMNHEKWHDGVGYDLSLLEEATPAEFDAIESLLISRSVRDWRDAEALAALDTERARESLRAAFETAGQDIRLAITRYAPEVVEDDERTVALVSILQKAPLFGPLSGALDEIVDFHPPAVIDALFKGLREREGDVAVHFAAMLFHLHGKSEDPFDFEHRDFFLRFNTDIAEEREAAVKELEVLIKTP